MILKTIKFNPLTKISKPTAGDEVIIFLHDKWRGYDELLCGTFDGNNFYYKNTKINFRFIAGWISLPIKIDDPQEPSRPIKEWSDSGEIANALQEISKSLKPSDAYFLKEAAIHIESLYDIATENEQNLISVGFYQNYQPDIDEA